jgi:DNA-binding Xre family transcriptional regulator
MEIKYDRLFSMLKDKNIMQKKIIEDLALANSTMKKLLHNESVTTETIGKICEYLQCQPSDIMEIIYDEDVIKANQEKAEIQAQIAELQKKLNKM